MAIGLGEGGEQTTPLGRAVVGGLLGATFATLFVLPALFAALQRGRTRHSASLDPDDPHSRHFDAAPRSVTAEGRQDKRPHRLHVAAE
jgi:hypothetical protein